MRSFVRWASLSLLLTAPAWAASIGGRVTYRNQPLARAIVTLYAFNPASMTRGGTYGTRTTASGDYNFASIPDGDYILTVDSAGRRMYEGRLRIRGSSRRDINLATQ